MRAQLEALRRHLLDLVRIRIWDQDTSQMSRMRAFAFRQLRVGVIFVKGFAQGRIQLRASAMTFTTLITLVPVLVITLSILQAFGALAEIQDQLEAFLIANLSPGSQEQFRTWLYGFFGSIRSGAFQGLTLLMLLGGVLGLLGSIEQAFNDIWGVHRGRSLFQRFSTYTTLMVFGPVLIGLSLSATASLETSALRTWIEARSAGLEHLIRIGVQLIPAVLTGFALTLLYTIMPNVKVKLRASLPAGLIAGLLWEVSKIGYAAYILNATHYGTLYGSLAAVPLFLIWVYLSWLVVLFGAQLAFARDAADDFRLEEQARFASQRERLHVALHLVLATARGYRDETGPPDLVHLAHSLRFPLRLVRTVAEQLVDGGILHLVASRSREVRLAPARSPDRISVYDVLACLGSRRAVAAPPMPDYSPARPPTAVDHLMRDLEEDSRERWAPVTISDLLDQDAPDRGQEPLPFPVITGPSRSRGLPEARKP